MDESTLRVFYRIVRTNPPTLNDFLSHAMRGEVPRRPLSARERDRWRGVSHYSTPDAAYSAARQFPSLGRFVAAVALPKDVQIRIE